MDDADARPEFSRGATLEDLITLCQNLNAAGVRYVVIGGFAIIHFGLLRATNDIDLLVDPSVENVKKLKSAMAYLPDKAVDEIKPDEVASYQVVRVADEIVVDLMAKACEITYESAASHIESVEVRGVKIPYLKPELLIKTKETYRPKDLADKSYLQELLDRQNEPDGKKPWWRW
jgi:hypothetical protein